MSKLSPNVRAALLVLLVLFAAAAPLLLPNYYLHTLTTAGLFILLTSGLNLIHGFVGRLSLGHTAFYGLGAYTAALLSTKAGAGLLLTIPLAIVVTVLAGLAIGHITLRFRGAHFVLVTLAFAAILQLLANNLVDFTGGPMGLSGVVSPLVQSHWGNLALFGSKASFYWLVLAFDIACVYVIWRISRSPIGDAMIALREDEQLAEAVGIDGYRYSMFAFVLGAAFAGSAGAIYAHYVTFVSPEIFSFHIMIMILVMVIIGSVGTVSGPIVGSLLVVVVLEVLRLNDHIREPMFGAILVGATLLFPQGLTLLASRLRWFGGPDLADVVKPVESAGSGNSARSAAPADQREIRKGVAVQADAEPVARKVPSEDAGPVLLEVQDLTVNFGGLAAVDSVSFKVGRGEIVGLIGPNGAGKTTTLNLLTGFVRRTSGRILLDRKPLPDDIRPYRVAAAGVIRTFQVTRGLLGVTIGKAVETGFHRSLSLTWPRIARAATAGLPDLDLEARARRLLATVGLNRSPDELTSNLSYGEQRLLEIAIALAAEPRLLVLDEPVAGMNPEETARMMLLIRRLRDQGTTILLVEHDMRFVMGLSDHLVVLDHGKCICRGTPRQVQSDPAVVAAYLGRGASRVGVSHAAA